MAALLTIGLFAALVPTPAEGARLAAAQLAQQTLARTLGVAEERVHVEDVRAVEWPDAALGCPEKGQTYAQMIVPGHSVRLELDGKTHEVHVGGGRAVICDRRAAPEAPTYFAVVARVQDLARRDLAERLKVGIREVEVIRLRPARWPDTSLGCAESESRDEKREIRGFVIELRHADKIYLYHSDQERVVLCSR